MKKLVMTKKRQNPWTWYFPVGNRFTPGAKGTNKLYWEWEIKHNNLKVL